MKNIFQLFFKTTHKNCFLVLYPLRNKTSSTLTTEYTFNKYIPENLKKITLHGFRHSHVSFLINHGANIKAIADRIGDTVDQVLKTYSHLFQKTEDELISLIEINQ